MSKSTYRFLKSHKNKINMGLTALGADFVFSITGHKTRQKNNLKVWRNFGSLQQPFKKYVHRGFNTINDKTRSMACVREQSRAKLALLSYAYPVFERLFRHSAPVYFVTIVQPQHYADIGKLHHVETRKVLRKCDDGMRFLRKTNPEAIGVAVVEIKAYRDRDGGVQFHPHVHLLVAGVPKEELSKVFIPRKISVQRPGATPVVIKKLTTIHDIGHRLSYMTKFKAHLSEPYEGQFSHSSRYDKEMPEAIEAELLEWLATVSISDIFCFSGFPRALVNKIYRIEMETIINRFLFVAGALDKVKG